MLLEQGNGGTSPSLFCHCFHVESAGKGLATPTLLCRCRDMLLQSAILFAFFFSFCPKGSSVICDCLCALASCFLIWFCLVLFFSSFVARGLLLCAVLCVLVWSSPDQSVILSWLNQLRSNMNDNENFSAHNLTLKRQARI